MSDDEKDPPHTQHWQKMAQPTKKFLMIEWMSFFFWCVVPVGYYVCQIESDFIVVPRRQRGGRRWRIRRTSKYSGLAKWKWAKIQTFRITSAAAMPGYGVEPNVTISHINIPKLQISDFTENKLSYNDSIAIHLWADKEKWRRGK